MIEANKTYRISYEVCADKDIKDLIIPFIKEDVLVSNIQVMELGKDVLLARLGTRATFYYGWSTKLGYPVKGHEDE